MSLTIKQFEYVYYFVVFIEIKKKTSDLYSMWLLNSESELIENTQQCKYILCIDFIHFTEQFIASHIEHNAICIQIK